MSNSFYVYLILDPRKFYSPFYVGKGKGDRNVTTLRQHGNNRLKARIIRRIREAGLEPTVLIWADGLDEKEAFDLETSLIARFGRRDRKSGILSNMTDGGEGVSGRTYSAEERAKMAARMRGAGSPTFGGHSQEACAKMSASHRKRAADRRDRGERQRHSAEHRERLRRDNPGGKATAKPIFQISETGEVLREWPSATAAAKEFSFNKGAISMLSKDGSHRLVHGFYWRRVGSADVIDGRLTEVATYEDKRNRPANVSPIKQVDTEGMIIGEWASVKEAAQSLGYGYHALWLAIKQGRVFRGYNWVRA